MWSRVRSAMRPVDCVVRSTVGSWQTTISPSAVALKESGATGGDLRGGGGVSSGAGGPWPVMTKPVIGAVNGPAITGGFELALQCDFLVASERARFGDTHTRVGVLPGWGLTVL